MDDVKEKHRRPIAVRLLPLAAVLLLFCVLLAFISAISNRDLPVAEASDRLPHVDKARLAEALHLKTSLGQEVWPGWDRAETPVILWNERYEFLAAYPATPPPEWTPVPGDELLGATYYRREAANPQNFAVRVGDIWAASIATKSSTDDFLISSFRDLFPSPLKQIFPYRVLIQPSETQIGGLLHETFHVYQIQISPGKLATAEAVHELADEYQAAAAEFEKEWKQESALLAEALEAETGTGRAVSVQQFLAARGDRHSIFNVSEDLVDYERWLEWEEGVAKYVEVATLKAAYESADDAPLPGTSNDPDFKGYKRFPQRWSQEMIQLRYQTSAGASRFYMTGMAQAFLLDELMPEWKSKILVEDLFLEDLLEEAVSQN